MREELDSLTKIYNQDYVNQNYNKYIEKYPDSRFVMIDFTNFKKVNDCYGHNMGDACLISFADKLKIQYKDSDSIVARLHGDEFAILTNKSNDEIKEIFEKIDNSIEVEASFGIIPLKFGFNAGSADTEKNMEITFDKADCMMYHAKKNSLMFEVFDESVYQEKIQQQRFVNEFNKFLKDDDIPTFSYYGRNMYNINDEETNNIQVYTKDECGEAILNGRAYETLRKNSSISRFDYINLRYLSNKISMTENNNIYFLNVDYRSLYSLDKLAKYLKYLKNNTINGISNIVLSLDLTGIETNEYKMTIKKIMKFKELGFKIRLDKMDNKIATILLEETNPEYIRINTARWKDALEENKKTLILAKELELYKAINSDVNIIFEQVENKQEKDYLKTIALENTLLLGNYYSKERKLKIK